MIERHYSMSSDGVRRRYVDPLYSLLRYRIHHALVTAGLGEAIRLGALSTFFVQDRYHASKVSKVTPTTLTRTCIQIASDTSTSTKCPAKDRKVPTQKTSRDCCPQRMAGLKTRHSRPGQSRGKNRMTR